MAGWLVRLCKGEIVMPPHEARTRVLPNLLVATACLCVGMLLARAMGF
jgi:hypothetical protein